MKTLGLFFFSAIFAVTTVFAQNPCYPNGCRTQTQGGWGADCHGNNNGCLRDANFATAFPTGLTIGGTYTIHFSTSAAVNAFLPAGGTPNALTASYNNPTSTTAGVFAGQVAALALSLGFSEIGVSGFCDLGSLYYFDVDDSDDPFVGMTVNELFALANQVLGGDLSGLPFGATVSDLNDVIDHINQNFDDGTQDLGHLDCDVQLAAELTSFVATGQSGSIELTWSTASEHNIERFEIERTTSADWHVVGSVVGQGDSPVGHDYVYTDNSVSAGETYTYRLVDISRDGSRTVMNRIVTVEAGTASVLPTQYALMQNYPNPFNPSTQITFSLPEASDVSLVVFDALGRQVATIANASLGAGLHTMIFDASNLSAGLYFYQLKAGDYSAVRKMMLIK
ncbi:MAG: T9SS type A sorting domain-containing protein [Calditrichaeota bacterium]|nr:T9SS type A sorting domain-containing protein [Calditrichota bacterium]MCB9369567.1 T9SS type A sorting domain-containing protein [Calditrichota bacterium]